MLAHMLRNVMDELRVVLSPLWAAASLSDRSPMIISCRRLSLVSGRAVSLSASQEAVTEQSIEFGETRDHEYSW